MNLNIFEISTFDKDRIKTKIETHDGAIDIEFHARGLSDVKIVEKLLNREYYINYGGSWKCIMVDEGRQFSGSDYVSAMQALYQYMEERDNPNALIILDH